MRIIVFVKIVPKLSTLPMSKNFTVDREEVTSSINPNDYFALEAALKLKEKNGGEVIALCLGNMGCRIVLREVYALGVDRVILISDQIFRGSDTYATSKILSAAVKKIGNVDVILAGKKSSDGSTSQVPNEVAEMLGWRCGDNVMSCDIRQNRLFYTERFEELDVEKNEELPLVISVSPEINIPRYPTINGLLAARKKEVEIWNNSDLQIEENVCGLRGSKTRVIGIEKVDYALRRESKIYTSKDQIIESFRAIKDNNHGGRGVSTKEIIKSRIEIGKNIIVFCEVCDGFITEESLYSVKKATLVAIQSNACVITVCTELEEANKQLSKLSEYGACKNYQLNIKNIYTSDKEDICEAICQICERVKPELIIFPGTQFGMNIAPYFAAMNGAGLTAECIDIEYKDGEYVQKRPAFGGRLNARIVVQNSKYRIATIKPFIEQISLKCIGDFDNELIATGRVRSNGSVITKKEKLDITQSVVIGCGNGIKKQELVELVKKICNEKGYGFSATREIVDKGWATTNSQVGLTGQVIAPKMYIAIGVSGAYEHVVGVEQSEVIVSVNVNLSEPMNKISDVVYQIDSEEFINNILTKEEMV